jgi:two-component system NtrC family sensor kinase
MQTARRSALRLLWMMTAACIVLPLALLGYASWSTYQSAQRAADERIERSLEVLHEHALKGLQTAELVMQEIDHLIAGRSDAELAAGEQALHFRLKQIAGALPQVHSIWVIDRDGHPQASNAVVPVPRDGTVSDRNYFTVFQNGAGSEFIGNTGTFVGEVLVPRLNAGPPFFSLSRRRARSDDTFDGVVTVSLLPSDFEKFYAQLGKAENNYYAMVRPDGAVLARHPVPAERQTRFTAGTPKLTAEIARQPRMGAYTAVAQIDGIERRFGYRKIEGYPIYAFAGVDTAGVRAEWLQTMAGHLIFGLPATLLLVAVLLLTMQRTRRLYAEADRRETAERALRQAQRLEALGQLTGGVAHDFNNLLMIVEGSVQRLRRDADAKSTRYLDAIATAIRRGEALTRQLLTFSRRQTLAPTAVDLKARMPDLQELLQRSLRGDIDIRIEVLDAPCVVKVDANELELAVLNLAVNARDAMPEGGALTLRLRPARLNGEARTGGIVGDFIALEVSDTGTGIPADVLPRVFEPFFTTKEFGKGTGLGLSQVYGFAQQSGGTVTLSSALQQGTTVTLYLPRSAEAPKAEDASVAREDAAAISRSVLLVEDNPDVAEVTTAYLQQIGHEVVHVLGAQQALDRLHAQGAIGLVISDILMPGGMSGVELARTIRTRFPHIPVLLVTGYASSAQEAVAQDFMVLQKPFDEEALANALRSVIEHHLRRTAAARPVAQAS